MLHGVDLFPGCAIAGAVRVPLYARNARPSHGQMLEQAAARVVRTEDIGRLDHQWGETPMAVCTVEPGATVTEAEIITLMTDRLGSHKKPSRVEFTTDPLPKSVVGKLQRKVLREPHWAGQQRRAGGA